MTDLGNRGPLGLKPDKKSKKLSKANPTPTVRASARNERCSLRLCGCMPNNSTVVLCHIRRFNWAGMAQKPCDLLACYACLNCHDILDRRKPGEITDTDILRAMGETLMTMLRNGIVEVKNG